VRAVTVTSLRAKTRIAVVSGVLLVVALGLHLLDLSRTPGARDAVLVVSALLAGGPVAVGAWRALRNRAFSIDLLVTITVAGALVIGEFVEAAVVSFLFVLGSYLEARTLDRTGRSLRALVAGQGGAGRIPQGPGATGSP
jgi:Cd2+/Zn2+-exporting ATPase